MLALIIYLYYSIKYRTMDNVKYIFRSVEFWKSAVMTMPDNSFYELLRSVFGKIKTPYQKQQLINELEIFLLREDIQKTITAFIDKDDAKVIAAVALFGESAPGELESFFCGELSYAQLQDIIVNLEERFILYRFREDKASLPLSGGSRAGSLRKGGQRAGSPHADSQAIIALNPVLEQALTPFTSDISILFPAASKQDTSQNAEALLESFESKTQINDLILAGLMSFVTQWEPFFRSEGVIRKRVIDAAKNCFPGLDIKLVLGSLQVLGLFYTDDDRLMPDSRQFSDFCSLSARERMEYCTAALLIFSEIKSLTGILPPLYRSKIKELTGFIHCFLDSLDAKLLYPEKTLKRLAEILKAKTEVNIAILPLLETMEKTGLITAVSSELKKTGITGLLIADTKKEFIKIDSSFSVFVYPEINLTNAINLSAFLNIREAGATVRFELTKDSVVRSFDKNASACEIIELLMNLSGGKVDDAIVNAVNEWEKLYKEVSLKKGIILSLSENRRHLAKTKPLADLICETAAPGLYLLPENAMDEAIDALQSEGVEIIARGHKKTANAASLYNYFPPLPSRTVSFNKNSLKTGRAAINTCVCADAAALTEKFHAVLKKMPLGKSEKAELSARIERRLILCETQLKEASLRYEKLEARNMDYAGKLNIAKQAIAQQSPVEIVQLGGAGENEERIFGVPKALEKENEELILVIDLAAAGEHLPDQKNEDSKTRRIHLGRISLLRRIKKSIFI